MMGIFLSADSNSGNLPAPIPIDFGYNNQIRSESDSCDACNIQMTCEWLEANTSGVYECCDAS